MFSKLDNIIKISREWLMKSKFSSEEEDALRKKSMTIQQTKPRQPDWEVLVEKTYAIEAEARKMLNQWLAEKGHEDWSGLLFFMNYPPIIHVKLAINHINSLNDHRLTEAAGIVTGICNKFGLQGKRDWHPEMRLGNEVTYTLHFPYRT